MGQPMGQSIGHRRGSVVGALLLCALAGCAAPSRVQPSPAAPPVVGRETVNATLWMQRAAEYRISAEQVYGLAAERLTTTIAAPGTAAVEQQGADVATLARLPTAVIVDLDETVLDNSFLSGAAGARRCRVRRRVLGRLDAGERRDGRTGCRRIPAGGKPCGSPDLLPHEPILSARYCARRRLCFSSRNAP